MKTVATHSGGFHADDVFAVATFQLLLGKENIQVIRTRDEAVIAAADYVVDVGGVYDHTTKRYDHHQVGAPVRDNDIPYAGFGLVWKHYGEEICGSVTVANQIEEKICQQVDAGDNGIKVCVPTELDISHTGLDSFVKTWCAQPGTEEDMDRQFLAVVDIVREYLARSIKKYDYFEYLDTVSASAYETAHDKRVIVSNESLSRKYFIETDTEVLVFPDDASTNWLVLAVSAEKNSFATKIQFPTTWRGLRDAELQTVSGIVDAVFCHKAGFMMVVGSKESGLAAAQQAK